MRQIDTTLFQGTQHNMEGCCFVHFLVSLHNWNVVKYLFIVQSVMLHFSHKVNWITGLKYVHNLIISCTHFEKIFILTTSLPEHDKTRDMQHTELNEDTMSWGGSIHPKLRCFFFVCFVTIQDKRATSCTRKCGHRVWMGYAVKRKLWFAPTNQKWEPEGLLHCPTSDCPQCKVN